LTDAASKNALNKFDGVLLKKYPAELEGFNEDLWRSEEREEVRELYGFIDDVWVSDSLPLVRAESLARNETAMLAVRPGLRDDGTPEDLVKRSRTDRTTRQS
jgi:hypothetical protein